MQTLKEIYAYREMIIGLVRKDLRGRYKGSVLGFLWTFINPLLQLVVYTLVFSTILRSGVEKFYMFLFVALIPWLFFSSALTGGSTAIMDQKEMVKKIYFPREVLPIAYVTSCFVNMLFCFVIVFAVVIFEGVPLSFQTLIYLPLIWIVEYLLSLGVAFAASAITVYFRDLQHILSILAMAWMYLTPIMYPSEIVPPEYMPLFSANPMMPIIEAYRDILYYGRAPQFQTLLHGLFLGVAVLAIGVFIFELLKKHFAEEL